MAFMEQSSYLFAGDSYDTPPDAPKSVWYRLLLKNRWYFYVNNRALRQARGADQRAADFLLQ